MRHLARFVAIVGISLVTGRDAPTADRVSESAAPSSEALVKQLGDKNFRVRQAAGKILEERGEDSLPALKLALNSTDEEIRRRVEILTQKIERSALLAPKRVSLNAKQQTIEEVVKELARQTGYKLQYQGSQPRRITIEMENVTYWQALEQICQDAGLSPGFDDQQGLVHLYQQDAVSPYTYHTGPFRFVATNFSSNRYVNLANIPKNGQENQGENTLTFGFMIQAEPKVPLLSVSPPRLSKAEDENGISLLPRQVDNEQQINVQYNEGNGLYRNYQHSTSAAMTKPSKEATKAKIIKGKVMVTLLSATKPDVVFDKLAVGKKKIFAVGQTVEIDLEEMTEQNKTYCLTLHIKRQMRNGDVQDYNWINGVQQKLELLDAKGNKYQSQGVTNFINNSATAVHATYQFNPPNNVKIGPAVKLVYNQWLTISQELEFEFKDLPLP